jgi:hypothetical protein
VSAVVTTIGGSGSAMYTSTNSPQASLQTSGRK